MAHQISLLSFFILLILTEVSIQLQDQEGCECPTGEINAGGCTYDNPKRCQPCPWGHFWYKPEGTESPRCWPCSKCTRMDEKPFQPCTPTSDTVCRCIHGTYLRHQSSFYCTPHSSCSAGKYVAITGSHLQDNLCKECPQGTFTDKRNKATSCTPYTDCAALNMTKIYPGNNSHDSVCGTQGSGFKDLAHLSTYTMKLHQGTTTNSYRSKQKERNITLPTKVVPPSGAGHPSVLVVAFLVVTLLLSIFILLFVVVGIWRRRNHFLTNGKNQIGAGLQDPERQVLQPRALSHVGSQQEEVNEQRVINEDETTAQDGREHTHLVQEDVTVDEDSKSSPCLEDVESEVCQTRKLVMQTHVSATSSALVPGDRTQECQSLDLNKNENKQGRQEVQKYLDLQGLACVNHGEQQTKQLGASRNENPNGFSNLIPGPLEDFGSKPAQVKVMGSCSKTVTPGEVHSRSVQDDHEKAKMSDNWAFKVFVEIMSQTVQWVRSDLEEHKLSIAVLDSGIQLSHPCFDRFSFEYENFVDVEQHIPPYTDICGHGTFVTAILCEILRDVKHLVKFVVIKVVDSEGKMKFEDLEKAYRLLLSDSMKDVHLICQSNGFPTRPDPQSELQKLLNEITLKKNTDLCSCK